MNGTSTDFDGRHVHPPAVFFSILVPVFRTRPQHLREMLDSVLAQTLRSWELVLVDDGSADAELSQELDRAERVDSRVVVVRLPVNVGIGAASQAGLDVARGEFVALVDHDDVVAERALERVADALQDFPDADVVYTDEDQIHDGGLRRGVFRKPAFSPERLRGQNYLGHLTCYRRALLTQIGGFREGFDGSQDYDLVLRATEQARRVVHVPEVLYHWRIHTGSVSHRDDNAPVFDAARRALEEHLSRTGRPGRVQQVHPTGVYRTYQDLAEWPPVTIVIPTRGSRSVVRGVERVLVVEAVRSVLEKSTYPHYDVLVVADAPTPDEVRSALVQLDRVRVRVLHYPYPFSYSDKINTGAVHAREDLLLFLNDDTEVGSPDWLETLVGHLDADVGMVGAKLLYEDGRIQHLGLRVGGGDVEHIGESADANEPGPSSVHWLAHEVSGVTGACALVPRAVFEQVGGLSPDLPVAFNDVDLGLKMLDAGYRVVVTPFAVLSHFESRTRVRSVAASEVLMLRRRWAHRLRADDFWRTADGAAAVTGVVPGQLPGRPDRAGSTLPPSTS